VLQSLYKGRRNPGCFCSFLLNYNHNLESFKMSIAILTSAVVAQKKTAKLELSKTLKSTADDRTKAVNCIMGVNQNADFYPIFDAEEGAWLAQRVGGLGSL
jgi:hypothetical protein